MKLTIDINCCLCGNKTLHEIDMPDGWVHLRSGIDEEHNGFCPDHAPIAEFAESQCPGCVGGWGDCPMWRAFAFSGYMRDITSDELASIRTGICPRRVNGTFRVTGSCIEDIDLSKQAASGGIAFATAIEEYIRRYP